MTLAEMFEQYKKQDQNNRAQSGGHIDIGPGHFDYPHQDGHLDEI